MKKWGVVLVLLLLASHAHAQWVIPQPVVNTTCTDQFLNTIANNSGNCASVTNAYLSPGTFSNITGVGTLTAGATGAGFTIAINSSSISGALLGTNGGTGVNNGSNTITLGGNLTTSGAFNTTFTTTAATNVTLPISGTLLTNSLTSADIFVGNGSNVATDVALSGDGSLSNSGALTISSLGGKAVSLAGSLTTSGAFGLTLTTTATTSLTLPTSGTVLVRGATEQATPGNPVGTTSTTPVMMGLAGAITPNNSGRIEFVISGDVFNSTAIADGAKIQASYGTGTAPSNAAAATGTTCGGQIQFATATTAEKAPFSVNCVVTGLTVSTAYWIDLQLAALTGGTATVENISISGFEM